MIVLNKPENDEIYNALTVIFGDSIPENVTGVRIIEDDPSDEYTEYTYIAFFNPKPYRPVNIEDTVFELYLDSENPNEFRFGGYEVSAGFEEGEFKGEFKPGLYIYSATLARGGPSPVITYIPSSDKFSEEEINRAASEIIETSLSLEKGDIDYSEYEEIEKKYGYTFTEA